MITETRPEVETEPVRPRRLRTRVLVVGLAAILLVSGFVARSWWVDRRADIRSGTALVDQAGLAARYGMNVTLVAVSAGGGLIDFRYLVVDPDKANQILHDPDLLPALVNEDSGATLVLRKVPHNHGPELQLGGTYFFLFANASNALQPGSSVTVIIGDVRLEHVVVQG